ncbi:MAG: fructosamine kinase family protein [Melioribacteraceae bacterium]|nr:fructosamine kinase family protein [Melioribacteraceae bacterium]
MLKKLEEILEEKIISTSSIGGGSIADSHIIKTESGEKYFVKSYGSNRAILQNEANGLNELSKSDAIRTPKVIAVTDDCLLLEFIETGKRDRAFSQLFGKQFAKMHRITSDKFGFYENNFIGSNPQINLPTSTRWIDFFWENRLLFQFKLAEQNGYVNSEFRSLFNKLEKLFPSILEGAEEPPTLLHGDLWGGNYLVDEKSSPVLIDPAVYYGNREADLAMTKLFGGFNSDFYSAYNDEYPLPDKWEYRINLYMLYHVLNHLNLFGSGYYSQTISIIKTYVS